MATFSISLPEKETNLIDKEAEKQHRSRSAQVAFILEQWLKKHEGEEN